MLLVAARADAAMLVAPAMSTKARSAGVYCWASVSNGAGSAARASMLFTPKPMTAAYVANT